VVISLSIYYAFGMRKLTAKQAAEKLGVNDSRVRQLIKNRRLPAEKYGNLWLIDEADLELVKDRKPTGRPPKHPPKD
jgi:excisionase family DNA binding protein